MAIKETLFGPKRYLTLRKTISIGQITDKQMYDDAGKKLAAYIQQNSISRSGGWSVLYFSWDKIKQKAEIGISFPVTGDVSVKASEFSIIDIPKSKAAMDFLLGPYEGLGKLHELLMKYVADKKYNGAGIPVMAIEEYVIDPMSDPNPENWVTNVYYFHN